MTCARPSPGGRLRAGPAVPVLAAFGDTVYNIGPRIACDTAPAQPRAACSNRRPGGCLPAVARWNKRHGGGRSVELPGLTKRRAKEMDLCLEGA